MRPAEPTLQAVCRCVSSAPLINKAQIGELQRCQRLESPPIASGAEALVVRGHAFVTLSKPIGFRGQRHGDASKCTILKGVAGRTAVRRLQRCVLRSAEKLAQLLCKIGPAEWLLQQPSFSDFGLSRRIGVTGDEQQRHAGEPSPNPVC